MNDPITFSPPLPCATLLALRRRCRKPATVATITAQSDGTYILQPVCKECTEELVKVYQKEESHG